MSVLKDRHVVQKRRHYLPSDFEITSWKSVESFFQELEARTIESGAQLRHWLRDRSELEAALSEELGWRYIHMTCDTNNPEKQKRFHDFVEHIEPKVAPCANRLDRKLLNSPFAHELEEEAFQVLLRNVKKDCNLYRDSNIELNMRIQMEQQQYGAVVGGMTVMIGGIEKTLPQASDLLQSTDRAVRESTYRQIMERRAADSDRLDELFSSLITMRHNLAVNANCQDYREYMFLALGRFDYSIDDCYRFHEAVAEVVVPMMDKIRARRKKRLGLQQLRPWDLAVDELGREPLRPFHSVKELVDKAITTFGDIDPYFAECLFTMNSIGHLDLDSRKGKAPGGYNYPLDETGIPFIFMNATSSLRDLTTLMHEGGHAVHSFLTRDLELTFFKHPPSEVAELASMSMEFLSMDYWHHFFDAYDLRRARRQLLEQVFETLPWVATVDKFQHWIYSHPDHQPQERTAAWRDIFGQFDGDVVDWTGLEHYRDLMWQKQLHIFEVPFYYIEYGIAQLGAVAIWKNYRERPREAMRCYKEALSKGYTMPIGKIYEAAGIRFDFSVDYIQELIDFLWEELERDDA